jgi:hypothetical protein
MYLSAKTSLSELVLSNKRQQRLGSHISCLMKGSQHRYHPTQVYIANPVDSESPGSAITASRPLRHQVRYASGRTHACSLQRLARNQRAFHSVAQSRGTARPSARAGQCQRGEDGNKPTTDGGPHVKSSFHSSAETAGLSMP